MPLAGGRNVPVHVQPTLVQCWSWAGEHADDTLSMCCPDGLPDRLRADDQDDNAHDPGEGEGYVADDAPGSRAEAARVGDHYVGGPAAPARAGRGSRNGEWRRHFRGGRRPCRMARLSSGLRAERRAPVGPELLDLILELRIA